VAYSGRKLPKEAVAKWPEIFGEVRLNVLPLRYLQTVLVNFKDGKTWEIRITSHHKREGWPAFEKNLAELVANYDQQITELDFKLDTERVKKDIEKETQRFLKKKKL